MHKRVDDLTNQSRYTGYGPEHGEPALRSALSDYYKAQGFAVEPSEVFVSEGAKADTANIQALFSPDTIVGIQNPVYPVYQHSNILAGRSAEAGTLVELPCNEDNNFFPNLPKGLGLIYFCNPNNPTGAVATREQLKNLVDYARDAKAVIVADEAYDRYIRDKNVPRSILEIPGARECTIVINSFSKLAGFTGVRLAWTIVPETLTASDSAPGILNKMWARRVLATFNGASNIAQSGGLAALTKDGMAESMQAVNYYMDNAQMIRTRLKKLGYIVHGGENAPYIWWKTPRGESSTEFFTELLEKAHVVATPGSGFGSEGEGHVRLSAFGRREIVEKALDSIEQHLGR